MKFYQTLEKELKKETNFVTDNGELKKWIIIDKAQNYDPDLIALLLAHEDLKARFFVEVKGVLVFKQSLLILMLEQKNYLNDSYTAYKNKIGLTIDKLYLKQRNEIELVWPFKDCILEGGQSKEEDKRAEIFFNQTLAQEEITQLLNPKVFTKGKRYHSEGEQELTKFNRNEKGTITDNLIIKGNNLLVLHSLKKEFLGKVKLIYIDPPYNTGNDGFKYNDNFNHSTWLTFMKNRLEVARELLSEDGSIFVSIDDNEFAFLKVLMDEIFGKENFETCISNVVKPEGRNYGNVAKSTDFILVYFKNKNEELFNELEVDQAFKYQDNVGGFNIKELRNGNSAFHIQNRKNLHYPMYVQNEIDKYGFYKISLTKDEKSIFECYPPIFQSGIKGVWRWGKDKVKNQLFDVCAKKVNSTFGVFQKRRKNTVKPKNYFNEKEFYTSKGTQEMKDLGFQNYFTNPKPEKLLKRIIEIATQKNDLVLDFFAGSGTSGAVAHKMNRQYILIEQMDYIHDLIEARLKKVIGGEEGGISKAVHWQGGGEFVYVELKKNNETFMEQIQQANSIDELLQIWETIKTKSYLDYNVDLKKQAETMNEFKAFPLEKQKQLLAELLDKNQLYVNLSSINDTDFAICAEDKQITRDFYKMK
ncbi:MAG: site-specific DNA-methyltransferase [Bacteroidetes bacterium]|nr:MAG: site-specific DNA-methyltransferase [Bacteroidota bacterium]